MIEYLDEIGLPDTMIAPRGEVSSLFREKGIFTLWEAINSVWQFPYERTTDRSNYLQVLKERRGTCSGKHALIAALAKELDIPLTLHLAIFLVTAENRPEIAPLLATYRLDAIPEAHAYLKYNNHVLDITSPHSLTFTFDEPIEVEEEITPDQIGEYKVQKHQEYIRKWEKNVPFERVWEAREAWIASLKEPS